MHLTFQLLRFSEPFLSDDVLQEVELCGLTLTCKQITFPAGRGFMIIKRQLWTMSFNLDSVFTLGIFKEITRSKSYDHEFNLT